VSTRVNPPDADRRTPPCPKCRRPTTVVPTYTAGPSQGVLDYVQGLRAPVCDADKGTRRIACLTGHRKSLARIDPKAEFV
jgi:hypothetical protein